MVIWKAPDKASCPVIGECGTASTPWIQGAASFFPSILSALAGDFSFREWNFWQKREKLPPSTRCPLAFKLPISAKKGEKNEKADFDCSFSRTFFLFLWLALIHFCKLYLSTHHIYLVYSMKKITAPLLIKQPTIVGKMENGKKGMEIFNVLIEASTPRKM